MSLAFLPMLVGSPAAYSQDPRAKKQVIVDRGEFFDGATIKNAETAISRIQENSKKTLLVETFRKPSAEDESAVRSADSKARHAYFKKWAETRAEQAGVDLYVFICKDPPHLKVLTSSNAGLTANDRDALTNTLLSSFKKMEFNAGLLATLAQTESILAASPKDKPASFESFRQSAESLSASWTSGSWTPWIIGGAVVLGAVLLIRLMVGGGGALGGGGLLTSILGGLFGAAAGMWLYDQFFGNNHEPADSSSASDPGHEEAFASSGGDFGDESGGDF
jgi:uncharacterized protein